jgi:Fe-S cluster assembly ATP-binding protein
MVPQSSPSLLEIRNLHASTESVEILRGLSLSIKPGEIHAIMGPNGSGKSTLSKVLAGHPAYSITEGEVEFGGLSLLDLSPDERAKKGMFLAFQYPQEVPGVSIFNFLRASLNARREKDMPVLEFRKLLYERMDRLEMDHGFATRFVNDGFSGGEKKRNEILQLAMLEPYLAIMDETDSGLDIDALRIVSEGINSIKRERPQLSIVLITHYNRILDYIKPDFVHVLSEGKIIHTGTHSLALELEEKGYDWIVDESRVS